MNFNIKLVNGGKTPIKKTVGAACFDCYSNESATIPPHTTKIIKLGFCIELPEYYYAEMRGRSGQSSKGVLVITGTIDSDYRGEVGAIVSNLNDEDIRILKGDRISQMIINSYMPVTLTPVEALSETERGSSGFGSTGIR